MRSARVPSPTADVECQHSVGEGGCGYGVVDFRVVASPNAASVHDVMRQLCSRARGTGGLRKAEKGPSLACVCKRVLCRRRETRGSPSCGHFAIPYLDVRVVFRSRVSKAGFCVIANTMRWCIRLAAAQCKRFPIMSVDSYVRLGSTVSFFASGPMLHLPSCRSMTAWSAFYKSFVLSSSRLLAVTSIRPGYDSNQFGVRPNINHALLGVMIEVPGLYRCSEARSPLIR